MSDQEPLLVKVRGDFALFTRPEFSAERVSYEVPTPSATRGICEAIYWKPEIRYRIQWIRVLKRIQQFSVLRNEVNSHQSERAAKSWEAGGGYFAEEDRAQRHSLCLRDVEYIIAAQMDLLPHATDNIAKYRDQFRRRVNRGQCFNQPYLGTREFSAEFEPVSGDEQSELANQPKQDLGWMLFDIEFSEQPKGGKLSYRTHDGNGSRVAQGSAMPKFFHAELEHGVLNVPQSLYSPIERGGQ